MEQYQNVQALNLRSGKLKLQIIYVWDNLTEVAIKLANACQLDGAIAVTYKGLMQIVLNL